MHAGAANERNVIVYVVKFDYHNTRIINPLSPRMDDFNYVEKKILIL